MRRFIAAVPALPALAVSFLLVGCTGLAPQYSSSIDNVQILKNAGSFSAKVGTFESSPNPQDRDPLTIRGSKMVSPYSESYAAYLAEAIRQELVLANRFSKDADVEISGLLLKNELDASGISVGTADIEARFVVRKAGQVRFDKVKSIRHEFPSAFAGMTAVPRAAQEYQFAVQKLLGQLYADKDFTASLR